MEEKLYGYTFPLSSGAIYLESPFKIHIGQCFDYWGYTWKVSGAYESEELEINEFFCEKI